MRLGCLILAAPIFCAEAQHQVQNLFGRAVLSEYQYDRRERHRLCSLHEKPGKMMAAECTRGIQEVTLQVLYPAGACASSNRGPWSGKGCQIQG